MIRLSGPEINCRLENCTYARLLELRTSELSHYDRMLLLYEIDARYRYSDQPLTEHKYGTV